MILEGLRVMLFGMAGIFVVMGIIIGAIVLMNRLGKSQG